MLLMKMMVWPLGSNVCALKLRHPGLPSPPPRPSVLFGTSLLYQITVTWKPNNIQASLSVWCNYITTITHRTHKIPIHLRRISEGCRKRAQLFALENTLKNIPKPALPSAAGRAHWTAVKLEMLPGVMHRHRHKHRAAVSSGVTRVTVKQWAARWRSAATEQMNRHTALLGSKIEAFIVCGLQRWGQFCWCITFKRNETNKTAWICKQWVWLGWPGHRAKYWENAPH